MLRKLSTSLPAGVPGCLKKRQLLNDKVLSPALCREYGEKFLAQGWWEDALEFFQKGESLEGIEKLRAHCLEEGDAYLLARLGKHDPALWRQVAERALQLGKLAFAVRALKEAGEHPRAEALARGLQEPVEPKVLAVFNRELKTEN